MPVLGPHHGIKLFGEPAVLVGDDWILLKPGKLGAVVSYAAHRGSPVRRAELAALLWPELDERRAHANLRQLLRSLVTGPISGCLDRDRDTVRASVASDVRLFDRAVEEARWADAVALYDGPLLDGFDTVQAGEFGSWLSSERAAAEVRWRQACLALLESADAGAWPPNAAILVERLLRSDHLDEVAVRLAMKAALARGDTVAARQQFERFRAALESELGLEPEVATLEIAERITKLGGVIETGELEFGTPPPSRHALAMKPEQGLPRFPGRQRVIGRSEVLGELWALLSRDDVRLLTLLAPGGMGKTTIAGLLSEEAEAVLPDGSFAVALEGVEGPEAVAPALAAAVGITLSPRDTAFSQVVATLAQRRALVVLDGFEEHLDEVPVVDALMRACPRIKLVVTSRTRLRLSLETVYEVGPIATATEREEAWLERSEPSDAAKLFLRAAARSGSPMAPTLDELAVVERICNAVGGSPLAIELVAAWMDVLSLSEVERQVQVSWELLRSEEVDRPPRQGDLQATLERTWRQLDPEDQAAWARLAVLPGSVDRSLAAAVAGSGWRGLRRLVDRSLLRHGGERLEMHALVARYGQERAAEEGWHEEAWETALLTLRERIALEVEPRTGELRRLHEHDLDQAIGIWRWALVRRRWSDVADMAFGLCRALERAARTRDLEEAVTNAIASLHRARGRNRESALARLLPFARATPAEALANAQSALVLAEECGDEHAAACATAALLRAEPEREPAARFAHARAAFESVGDSVGLATLLLDHGDTLVKIGRVEPGGELLREALTLCERLADELGQARAREALAEKNSPA